MGPLHSGRDDVTAEEQRRSTFLPETLGSIRNRFDSLVSAEQSPVKDSPPMLQSKFAPLDQADQLPIGSRTEHNLREESLPQSPEQAFETMMAQSRPKQGQRKSGSYMDEISHVHEHASHRNLPDAFVHVKKFANRHVRDSDGSVDQDNAPGAERRPYNDNSEEDAIMSEAMENLLEETPNLYNTHQMLPRAENPPIE